jgi:GNAT superfamily N-acetyltransferase
MTSLHDLRIERASEDDVSLILTMIKALADYEHLALAVVATEETVRDTLFGSKPSAEVLIARIGTEAVGFAVWFFSYSTFLARPGLYLEDLFVLPGWRGHGIGHALLVHLARVAVAHECGRMEWSVLDWNESAIRFYRSIGARPMDEWTLFRLTGGALEDLASGK